MRAQLFGISEQFMKTLLCAGLVLLLAGCAEYTAVSNAVKVGGAAAYDQALSEAEFVICYAASVGSVRRRYGGTQEMADTYHKLCSAEGRIVQPEG